MRYKIYNFNTVAKKISGWHLRHEIEYTQFTLTQALFYLFIDSIRYGATLSLSLFLSLDFFVLLHLNIFIV